MQQSKTVHHFEMFPASSKAFFQGFFPFFFLMHAATGGLLQGEGFVFKLFFFVCLFSMVLSSSLRRVAVCYLRSKMARMGNDSRKAFDGYCEYSLYAGLPNCVGPGPGRGLGLGG
jgi:hypothetical protein